MLACAAASQKEIMLTLRSLLQVEWGYSFDFFFVLRLLSASQCYDYVFALFLEMWQKYSMKSFVLLFARNFGQIMKLINNHYQGLMTSVGVMADSQRNLWWRWWSYTSV
jgi:hypothetical protein